MTIPLQVQRYRVNRQAQIFEPIREASSPLQELLEEHDPIGDLREAVFRTAAQHGLVDNLLEAFVATPDAQNLLRDGIKFLSFLAYAEKPQSFRSFTSIQSSSKPQEEWLRDSIMGTIPRGKSGQPAPILRSGLEGGALIKNYPYFGLVEITGDDIRFDRLGKIKQVAPELGRSGRMTEEAQVYADITNTVNYTRSKTANDNDVGANTQTLVWNAKNFEIAYTVITTTKDRKSGAYMGLMPNKVICGPRMIFPVKQLLMGPELARVGGSNANEERGTGKLNMYLGMIDEVIVSPWFGDSWQWALCDSSRESYIMQVVEPFNVVSETSGPTSETWMVRDVIRHKITGYFGTGFVDDRAWFFSDSTSEPTIS